MDTTKAQGSQVEVRENTPGFIISSSQHPLYSSQTDPWRTKFLCKDCRFWCGPLELHIAGEPLITLHDHKCLEKSIEGLSTKLDQFSPHFVLLGGTTLGVIDVGMKFLHQSHINVILQQLSQLFVPIPPFKLSPKLIKFPMNQFHIPLTKDALVPDIFCISSLGHKGFESKNVIINIHRLQFEHTEE